jgi:hypothetical protein
VSTHSSVSNVICGKYLGVDGAKVSVLKETNQVCLRSFLQGCNGSRLETKVSLEVLGNLPHETLEGELADEELSALLVPPDLTQGDGTRPESVGLLYTSYSF